MERVDTIADLERLLDEAFAEIGAKVISVSDGQLTVVPRDPGELTANEAHKMLLAVAQYVKGSGLVVSGRPLTDIIKNVSLIQDEA